jgi:predicted DNA binding CopG/RHH family protein
MNKTIGLRVSYEDYSKIKEKAEKLGISISSYIRYMIYKGDKK